MQRKKLRQSRSANNLLRPPTAVGSRSCEKISESPKIDGQKKTREEGDFPLTSSPNISGVKREDLSISHISTISTDSIATSSKLQQYKQKREESEFHELKMRGYALVAACLEAEKQKLNKSKQGPSKDEDKTLEEEVQKKEKILKEAKYGLRKYKLMKKYEEITNSISEVNDCTQDKTKENLSNAEKKISQVKTQICVTNCGELNSDSFDKLKTEVGEIKKALSVKRTTDTLVSSVSSAIETICEQEKESNSLDKSTNSLEKEIEFLNIHEQSLETSLKIAKKKNSQES